MHGRKVEAIIGAVLLLAIVAGAAVAQSFSQVVNLTRGQTAYVSCDGAARLRTDRQSEWIVLLSCGRAEQVQPTATVQPPPAATATSTPVMPPGGDMTDMHWHPAGVAHGDRPAHEHGDAPPQWVLDAGYDPMFTHDAGTPGENVAAYKHTAFKGWAGRFGAVDWYGVFHLDTNPIGQAGRFHSYQLWMRDAVGAVSHFSGWLDFGVGDSTGSQKVVVCGTDSQVRPIIMVNQAGCPVRFENWYARAGGSGAWAPDVGFNINPTYYDIGGGDPTDPAQWQPINGFANNVDRRVEWAWYAGRSSIRGEFWATQWGDLVSGPDAPVCGTQRTIGGRAYTVLCLRQYIAPTLPSVEFPGNSVQRTFPADGVTLPN